MKKKSSLPVFFAPGAPTGLLKKMSKEDAEFTDEVDRLIDSLFDGREISAAEEVGIFKQAAENIRRKNESSNG